MERILSSLVTSKIGEKVKIAGWVANIRDHGQLLFVDLRDWDGIVQLVIDKGNAKVFETAKELGHEYVIGVVGEVVARDAGLVNEKIESGSVEVIVEELEIINRSLNVPFPLEGEGYDIDETVRLTYRYLDLRRERIRRIIKQKHQLLLAVRNFMSSAGFTEVITPLLTSSSPEGARDFFIPSRLHKGKFFVLPQAPQQYKQLLMVGGVDKYFQIAPCARDEDPRADRHAGIFYQIDVEISFPTIDAIFSACENLIQNVYKSVAPHKTIAQFPFPRIPYEESLDRFGSDKPDLRFGFELNDITSLVKGKSEFNVFNNAEFVKCIAVDQGEWTRKEIAELEEFAKRNGAKGLAYTKVKDGKLDGGIAKFIDSVGGDIITSLELKEGDTLFFAAGERAEVNKILGTVRSKIGADLGLLDPNILNFAWITEFPFYEASETSKTGVDFCHNPFSMPQGGAAAFETDDPLSIKSNQYDLALNGYEILSGSIRNHDPEVLVKAFEVVGYGREEVIRRFGGMYKAFQYGAPPHGGWAIGFDRFFMVLIDEPNIRDTYAFPKNSNGMDLMMNAPSEIDPKELEVLGIEMSDKGDKLVSMIKSKLDAKGVNYEMLEHEPARTSEEAAQIRGTKLSDGAKALILKSLEYEDKYVQVVIPADKQLSIEKVSSILGEKFEVANGEEVERNMGVQMGGVPPFGRLLGCEVYFDSTMWNIENVVFNCGRRDRSVKMKGNDLIEVAQPNAISEKSDFLM